MNIFMLMVFLHILDYSFKWEELPGKGYLLNKEHKHFASNKKMK